jgi:hypothetical protein
MSMSINQIASEARPVLVRSKPRLNPGDWAAPIATLVLVVSLLAACAHSVRSGADPSADLTQLFGP